MKSGQIELSTTATKIVSAEPLVRSVVLHVVTSATVYIGGNSTVTTSTGLKLDDAAGPQTIIVAQNEELYGIAATGTPIISYLTQGD